MRHIYRTIIQVAASAGTILLVGESGTGKELIARAIHRNSPRQHKPFIALNCAAFSEGLLENELFGHEPARIPAPTSKNAGSSNLPTAACCFSMRSARSASPPKPSCCGCWRLKSSYGWEALRRSRSTSLSFPRLTLTLKKRSAQDSSRGSLLPFAGGDHRGPPLAPAERRHSVIGQRLP